MAGTRLVPEKITSPIQLMAAWFAMLVLLVSILLTAAVKIERPDWAPAFLILFCACVVVAVFSCVILMLTKFRPHLQEGKEYSQWLKDQNSFAVAVGPEVASTRRRKTAAKASAIKTADSAIENVPLQNTSLFVVNAAGAEDLVEDLRRVGYTASIYQPPFSYGEVHPYPTLDGHESIWMGGMVPLEVARKTIELAIKRWPQLKYFHLSGDTKGAPDESDYEIFFGGSTETAERYGLKAWTAGEISDLLTSTSIRDFHQRIRQKYQPTELRS